MEPTTLEYGSRDTPEPRRPLHVVSMTALAVLTLLAAATCVRIEVLNRQAGFYLPRPASDGGKWRTVPGSEHGFRLTHALTDPTLASRPLSPEERRAIRRGAANNQLREVVATWGLAQYPVVTAALVISVRVLLRRPTLGALAFAAGCLGLGLVCGVAMLYRGYFGSLGC